MKERLKKIFNKKNIKKFFCFPFNFLFKSAIELIENKNTPFYLKYPLICLLVIAIIVSIGGLAVLSIYLFSKHKVASILITILDIFLIIGLLINTKEKLFRNRKLVEKIKEKS